MEETIAGFKIRGDWATVVEHGERITRALREIGADERYPDAFEEWDEWRPKSHEEMKRDVGEKTADQASVAEGKGEKAGKTAEEDLRTAGERLTESYEELEEDDPRAAMDKWNESIGYVARAADSAGRKALRTVENTVYKRVMTQLAPYFFDNELVSANLQRTTRGNGESFIFEVNVNDDECKEGVSTRLSEYEDTIDRWHVAAEKEVETVSAAEGHEVTEEEVEATTAIPEFERVEEVVEPEVERPSTIEGERVEKDKPPGLASNEDVEAATERDGRRAVAGEGDTDASEEETDHDDEEEGDSAGDDSDDPDRDEESDEGEDENEEEEGEDEGRGSAKDGQAPESR